MTKLDYLNECVAELDYMYHHSLITESEYRDNINKFEKRLAKEIEIDYDMLCVDEQLIK
jgi:hypothetical protein